MHYGHWTLSCIDIILDSIDTDSQTIQHCIKMKIIGITHHYYMYMYMYKQVSCV